MTADDVIRYEREVLAVSFLPAALAFVREFGGDAGLGEDTPYDDSSDTAHLVVVWAPLPVGGLVAAAHRAGYWVCCEHEMEEDGDPQWSGWSQCELFPPQAWWAGVA